MVLEHLNHGIGVLCERLRFQLAKRRQCHFAHFWMDAGLEPPADHGSRVVRERSRL